MKTVRRKPRGFESLSLRHLSPATILSSIVLASLLFSCSGPSLKTYGTLTGKVPVVAIPDLLSSPEIHLGKEVAIQGVVAQVCQEMGCWFELAESNSRLMVDLQMGRHFTVPKESEGLRARVEGTFVREEGVLKVIGRGVELKPASGA